MMHEELVTRERWVTPKTFTRVLGIYQALPGPEATELAVHFGYVRRQRWGGLLAGLGFVLPGFLLMLLVSWAYVHYGTSFASVAAWLYGLKAVVIGMLLNALVRIGMHAYTRPAWWAIGASALVASFLWNPNLVLLAVAGGVVGLLAARRRTVRRASLGAFLPLLLLGLPWGRVASWLVFGFFFLKAGLFTFGGAYTVLPFLQEGAVDQYGWLTHEQFLDGIALGGLLPAPLIIVATFIGYLHAGFWGSLVATVLIFLPAFVFTLVGFRHIVRLVDDPRAHAFFDGLTAAVVALIALVAFRLSTAALPDAPALVIATLGFLALRVFRLNVALVILGGGALGALVEALRVL